MRLDVWEYLIVFSYSNLIVHIFFQFKKNAKKRGRSFSTLIHIYIYIDQYLYTHLLLTISLRGWWLLPAISCYPAKYKCIAFVHFASNLIHKQDNLSKCQSHQSWTPAPCSGETSLGWATFEVSVFSWKLSSNLICSASSRNETDFAFF